MALNIKNERTVALVRALAERTGQSQTSAVETAVRAALERTPAREEERASRLAGIEAAVAELHAHMTDAERQALRNADRDMYDENGLPVW